MALAAVVLVLPAVVASFGCGPRGPALTVEVSATTPSGDPLPGVAVEMGGEKKGETDAQGKLSFEFRHDAGEEVMVSATLDRPGLKFKPWEQRFVVRKWDPARPETMRYALEAKLEPVALSAEVSVQAANAPAGGAEVQVDGRTLKADSGGSVHVDLGRKLSRSARLSVRYKGYEPAQQAAELRAGQTVIVNLGRIGAIYAKVLAAYERMGRLVPVPGADVVVGGEPVGRTDEKGVLKFEVPGKAAQVEVKKAGFAPDPAVAKLTAGRAGQIVVPLVPREATVYRVAVLPPQSGSPGDKEVEAALPEIEDKLADYLFSHACFEKADGAAFLQAMRSRRLTLDKLLAQGWAGTPLQAQADAVVATTVSKNEGLVLSIRMVSVRGRQLGAFAETGKLTRVKSLCEQASSKIVEMFPFEGHVIGFDSDLVVTSLGSGRDRGVHKGDAMTLYKWTAAEAPKLTPLGKAMVRRVDADVSRVELSKGAQKPGLGDKVVLLPRAAEAAFDAAVNFTVKAGKTGAEQPLADVTVYRDGVWVGVTSPEGQLRVPAGSGQTHVFLFTKGGIKPYQEQLKISQSLEAKTILLPQATAHLRLESEPSGARVLVDDQDVGTTPLEAEVLMGFHRVKVEAGGDWRTYDKVIEFTSVEEDYTGGRRLVLQKDVLKAADSLLEKSDVDGAIALLVQVQPGHPDYSAAHHRLAGLYLDAKKDPAKAIAEYKRVLELPENKELVNKRFAVAFLNLGRAYYLQNTPEAYERAISELLIARSNKRFFPRDQYDHATHDTLYFLALATQKLYHARQDEKLLRDASARWKDYFDFFPATLQDDAEVKVVRTGAEQYYEEIKRKLKETE
jgi:tetratricopeptide (TPR) repeat protein